MIWILLIVFPRIEGSLKPDVVSGVDGPCRAFVEGTPDRREFTSPNYPNYYPNHTDCVRVIEAPRGQLLRLDFRETFELEQSGDCRFDFLEVRDGAHGYSSLLGQFCGKAFPPMLTSSGRHLWLRFHSDENIEYGGFKAVYEFIPRPPGSPDVLDEEPCRIERSGFEGSIGRSDVPEDKAQMARNHSLPLDCVWAITVLPGWKIQLAFLEFKLDKPNDCDSNFVDVFSDRTDLPSRQKNFCGSIADSVLSRSNLLYVRFVAEARASNSTFKALFTAYREKDAGQTCADDEWDCEDATCIAVDLRCNGRINCRFRWDEDECSPGMCFTFVFNCVRKLVRDHRTIQEHLRRSRDLRMDEKSASPVVARASPVSCYVPVAAELVPVMQLPPTADTACQTRESLFSTFGKTPCEPPGDKKRPFSTKSAPDVVVSH